ncbi:DUF397 domain-containing protein [Spirillospora sp. NPDC029432]|uniref:DUF397 domain-containing protein n=1 Tax=Spirillospora sp. NPDC029432 TaxID=3154599 RepID=UPI003451CF3D
MGVSDVTWRKASRSSEQGDNCVEVASLSGAVAFRDSRNSDGPMLVVNRDVFRCFVDTLKHGLMPEKRSP